MQVSNITMYGAAWCADCRRSKTYLEAHNIPFEYIDIESVPGAAETVASLNDGLRVIPTIVFEDGTILAEPKNDELGRKLGIVI